MTTVEDLFSDDVIDDVFGNSTDSDDEEQKKLLENSVDIKDTPFVAPKELVEGTFYKEKKWLNTVFSCGIGDKKKKYRIIWPGNAYPKTDKKNWLEDITISHVMYAAEVQDGREDGTNMIGMVRMEGSTQLYPVRQSQFNRIYKYATQAVQDAISNKCPLPVGEDGIISIRFERRATPEDESVVKKNTELITTHIADIPYAMPSVWAKLYNFYKEAKLKQKVEEEEEEDMVVEVEEKETKKTKKADAPQRRDQKQRMKDAAAWKGDKLDYVEKSDALKELEEATQEHEEATKKVDDDDEDDEEDEDYNPKKKVVDDEDDDEEDEESSSDNDDDPVQEAQNKVVITDVVNTFDEYYNKPDSSERRSSTRLKKSKTQKPTPIAKAKAKKKRHSKQEMESNDVDIELSDDDNDEKIKKPQKSEAQKPTSIDKGKAKRKRQSKPKKDTHVEDSDDEKITKRQKTKTKPSETHSKKQKATSDAKRHKSTPKPVESDHDDDEEEEEEDETEGYNREKQKRWTGIKKLIEEGINKYKESHNGVLPPDPFKGLFDISDLEDPKTEEHKLMKARLPLIACLLCHYAPNSNSLCPLPRVKKVVTKPKAQDKKTKKDDPLHVEGFEF